MNLLVPQRTVDILVSFLIMLLASYLIESKGRVAGTGSVGGNAIAVCADGLPQVNSES